MDDLEHTPPCEATTGCRRPATHGRICAAHLERLGTILRDIEDESAVLSAVPSMAVKTGRTGSLASHRSPAVLDAIVATDPRRGHVQTADPLAYDDTASVLDTLHYWASVIREHRRLAYHPPTIATERDLLTRQLNWIAEQTWIDLFYAAMSSLLAQLKRTNHTEDDKPAGRCYLPDTDGTCNGPIWIDDAAGHAHCGRCRQTWDGAQLALLHHALEQAKLEEARPKTSDGRPMLTAHELVDQGYVTSISNVRVTAHRRGHTAVDGHYDPQVFTKQPA